MTYLLFLLFRLLSFFRPHKRFSPGGVDYLYRWYLTPTGKSRFAKWYRRHLPGVFLHCFLASDPDRGWHSHPWTWAYFWILDGWYMESRPRQYFAPVLFDDWKVFGPGSWNSLTGADWHKVKLGTNKVWTLGIIGPLHGLEWGFMDEFGVITPHGTDTPGD